MGRQIIIGQQGNQPFAIQDPKVSRRHAYLNIDDNGNLFLVDNQSTNGTFIYNGQTFVRIYPNQPYSVSPDSMIQLGPETRFHINRLLNGVQPNPIQQPMNGGATNQARKTNPQNGQARPAQPQKPKRVDISHLRRISDNYDKQKMNIESKVGMINSLRSCTILITLLAGTVGTFLSKNLDFGEGTELYVQIAVASVAIVLMVVLLLVISNYNKKLVQRREENNKEYSIKYVCPECRVSFRGKIYENILAERRCPRCKAEYFENNESH